VNAVAPLAMTRLTEDVLPGDLGERLRPELVAPLVLYLCSSGCPASGAVYNAGSGYFGRVGMLGGRGVWLGDADQPATPEMIAEHWPAIISLDAAQGFGDAGAALASLASGAGEPPVASPVPAAVESAEPRAWANVSEAFAALSADLFQPAAAGDIDIVFQFSIAGRDGGDWYVWVTGGQCTAGQGRHKDATTTFRLTDDVFMQIASGHLPAMQAFASGKLAVEGDLTKAQLIERLFRF
jgi:putative sterol carrier protein